MRIRTRGRLGGEGTRECVLLKAPRTNQADRRGWRLPLAWCAALSVASLPRRKFKLVIRGSAALRRQRAESPFYGGRWRTSRAGSWTGGARSRGLMHVSLHAGVRGSVKQLPLRGSHGRDARATGASCLGRASIDLGLGSGVRRFAATGGKLALRWTLENPTGWIMDRGRTVARLDARIATRWSAWEGEATAPAGQPRAGSSCHGSVVFGAGLSRSGLVFGGRRCAAEGG